MSWRIHKTLLERLQQVLHKINFRVYLKLEQRNPLPLHLKKVAIITAPMVRVRTMEMEMGPFRMMILQMMMKMMMKIMKIYLSGHNHQKNLYMMIRMILPMSIS